MKSFAICSLALLFCSTAARELALRDLSCPNGKDDGVIMSSYVDAQVYYLPNFNCPKPGPDDPNYFCRTRTSDNTITFSEADNTMIVDTTPWFGGGFRMGCMKKDFTTGWQCAAGCGVGTGVDYPTISDWAYFTFDLKVSRTSNCNGRVKFVKKWPSLSSEYVELTGNYVDTNVDADGFSRVIIPTHHFKTCDWPTLDTAKDIIFENCGTNGEHPKYEVRNMILTDYPETFENCHCTCEEGSHDDFINHCENPTPAPTEPKLQTVFKDLCDLSGATGSLQKWFLPIPADASDLYCKTWGGTGNVALFANWHTDIDTEVWSNNKCAVNDDGCNNQEECSGSKLEPYGENLHVGILGIESYDGVCMTCSYKVLDDSNTADYGVAPTETAVPTLAPVPQTSASASTACSLKCPNCFALDATACTCIPAANDSCDPCAPVTFDDGTSMTGDDFCAIYMSQNYKCCPPTSNCKKGIVTSRTGSDPESRDVSAVCSTNCGGCDAESASGCTLFDELTLGCDAKTRTDDLFEVCAGEENQIFTDLC